MYCVATDFQAFKVNLKKRKMPKQDGVSTDEDDEIASVRSVDEFVSSEEDDGNSVSSSTTSSSIGENGEHLRKKKRRKGTLGTAGSRDKDFSQLSLKDDHEERPLWVTPECVVYLERMSRFYVHAYEFLSTVGEPVSRSEHLHEWVLTKNSLHAASSVEMTPRDILDELEKLSKVNVPKEVKTFVQKCADSYGKVKIVLKKGDLFVESKRKDLLQRLLRENSVIRDARIPMPPRKGKKTDQPTMEEAIQDASKDDFDEEHEIPELGPNEGLTEEHDEEEEELGETQTTPWRQFRIDASKVEAVKRAALSMNLPLMEEFDYKIDLSTPHLEANLKNTTEIRPYQQKCLSKMFGNSRAKSGVFVLPCGAGKTLTAIAAVCTMQKSALILCSGTVAVEQWKRQFHQFANVSDDSIIRFTSKAKDDLKAKDKEKSDKGCVLITTYSMMLSKASNKQRKTISQAQEQLDKLLEKEWGLLVLDEVHVTPASAFRRIVNRVKAHCKLGLTATLVREDELIQDLSFLIGPKLYEANWMDLTEQGFLARVSCQEIRCPMTEEFMAEYLRCDQRSLLKHLLVSLNPNKFRACEYLMHYHEQSGDKVLIFCDNILAIEYYASVLKREFIHGGVPDAKRLRLLGQFQNSPAVNTLLISKVGDVAIDLPEANVIIQVSGHYGSRRQEAQRLGRILRAKPNTNPRNFNAHFYTLISPDTDEQYYANRRQRYLVDQGYAFKVVDNILQMAESAGLRTSNALASIQDQKILLAKLLITQDKHQTNGTTTTTTTTPAVLDSSALEILLSSSSTVREDDHALPAAKRVERSSLATLSSAAGMTTYTEFQKKSD